MNKPLRPSPGFGRAASATSHGARRDTPQSAFLTAETEAALARRWHERGDIAARNRLVSAHQPLAASILRRVLGVSAAQEPDLMQHAHLGLLKAADRYDPDLGHRFSTYAAWWVRAEIQEARMKNWSLVRRGNSARARKMFFNLGRIDAQLSDAGDLPPGERSAQVARNMGFGAEEFDRLRDRFAARDSSLNVPVLDADGHERQDLLPDPDVDTEAEVSARLDTETLRHALAAELARLPPRERTIVLATQVADPPRTLADLGAEFGISRERVRQLRERGLERLRAALGREWPQAGAF